MKTRAQARALVVALAAVTTLTAGCSATSTSQGPSGGSESTVKPGSESMAGADVDMDMDMGNGDGPSDPASMICRAEIRDAVRRTFALGADPTSTSDWSKSDRLFSCTYRMPRGQLMLSVQDSVNKKTGRAYFDGLRGRLGGATAVRGMASFGFPAFETSSGNVVFLKDGKTLQVDATRLPEAALPAGFSAAEAAYSVASAVIACWSE